MKIDEFTLEHIFHKIQGNEVFDTLWWREVKDGGEGYILIWDSGDGEPVSHHTYHYPPNIYQQYVDSA